MNATHVLDPMYVLKDGFWTQVVAIIDHAPGEHADSPIADDMPAREWATDFGSRWSGLWPHTWPATAERDSEPVYRPRFATQRDGSDAR